MRPTRRTFLLSSAAGAAGLCSYAQGADKAGCSSSCFDNIAGLFEYLMRSSVRLDGRRHVTTNLVEIAAHADAERLRNITGALGSERFHPG